MIGQLLLGAMAQVVVPQPQAMIETSDPCEVAADPGHRSEGYDPLTVEQLAGLADLGRPMADQGPRAFAISPDREKIAVLVTRANAEANAYCQRLVVIPMSGAGPATEVARGGDFDFADFSLRDFSVVFAGWQKANPPKWSPDGKSLAYLRRENGRTQIWIAEPSGYSPPRQVSRIPSGVDDFVWTEDSSALVAATRRGLGQAMRAIAQEGLGGYLFDERFSPQFADHPIPTGPQPTELLAISVTDGTSRRALEHEAELIKPSKPESLPDDARFFAPGEAGLLAWLEPVAPERLLSRLRLVRTDRKGRERRCESIACDGIYDLWWFSRDRSLIAIQRSGRARSETTVLRWFEGEARPRVVMTTNDVLTGCELSGSELICGREGSTQPRRLVAISIEAGTERVLFDPNPRIHPVSMGHVERFFVRNAYGVESFADLVLPPDHRAGERHPLVVVQYESRGFLRGGTGNEVPIHPLAGRGFAVLSFHRPGILPAVLAARTVAETRTLIDDPWADRAQILSSLELAIEQAIETGAVDPERIGISGFSDGGGTVQYALINSDLFKVASLGSCCEDLGSYTLAAGPGFADFLQEMNYPRFGAGDDEFWQPVSLLLNVERIKVPILIQASDSEYEGALDVVEVFRNQGRPLELFVFPGETHFKWQPAHRLAIYERNVDWFEFWLARRIDCDGSKADQYTRWLALAGAPDRSELSCAGSVSFRERTDPVFGFEDVQNTLDQR